MTEIAIRPDDAGDSAAARSRHPDAAANGRPVRPALRHLLVPTVAAIAVGLAGLGAFVGAAPSPVAAATSAATAPLNLADLAARVSPAVVTISSAHEVAGTEEASPEFPFDFPPGSPFEDFFRHFREQQQRPDQIQAE